MPKTKSGQLDRTTPKDQPRLPNSWQADAFPLAISIETNRQARPVALMIIAGGYIVHTDMLDQLSGEAADVAAALADGLAKAARAVGAYPEAVQVRHGDVAAELQAHLRELGVSVVVNRQLDEIEEAGRGLLAHMTGRDHWPPVAASARNWTVSVLGAGGQEFGLAMYSRAQDLYDIAELVDDLGPRATFERTRGRMLSLTFSGPRELPKSATREVRAAGWEVAAPKAMPWLFAVNTPGGGVSRADVLDLIALLRAVPAFARANRTALAEELEEGLIEPIRWRDRTNDVFFKYPIAEDPLDSPEVAEMVASIFDELGPGATEEDVARVLAERATEAMSQYNTLPQPELGGLSPEQVRRLLEGEWNDRDNAVRIRNDLSLEAFENADLIANARMLLSWAAEKPLPITQAGFLKPVVLKKALDDFRLIPEFALPERARERVRETEISPVYVSRVLLELAGLLQRKRSTLAPTLAGLRLLSDTHAGELVALLFQTHFRSLNLDTLDLFWQWPELQQGVAFTLCKLQTAAADWRSPDKLASDVLLPYVQQRAAKREAAGILLESRVLRPMVAFGLMEDREPPKRSDVYDREYRKTPLFDQFLHFDLD